MSDTGIGAVAPVAVIGGGLIGRSWSIVFARAGHDVTIFDADGTRIPEALEWVAATLTDMEAAGLVADSEVVRQRIRGSRDIEEAVDGAAWIQECTLEVLETKRAVFAQLDSIAPPSAVLASSSSGLTASTFTTDLPGRRRCLIAHPINPPHLVPLVEIVPSPWSDEAVVAYGMQLMFTVGQVPIRVGEIDGFAVNRLQGALLDEAFRLVDEGQVSPEDVDRAIVHGLGTRWSFMGPFETIDLNAAGGVRDYAERYKQMYFNIVRNRSEPQPWGDGGIEQIEAWRRAVLPLDNLAKRQAWRDRKLMSIAAARARQAM